MNNLNLIIGEDNKEIDFNILNILNKIDYTLDNKIIYDLNESTLSDILDEASMISLFSDIKVIIGNNFDITKLSDDDNQYLAKYITNVNKNAYIILIAPKVDGRVKAYKIFNDSFNIIDTTKIDNKDKLFNYIKETVKNRKFKISDSDITYLLSKTGNDINNINQELEKLFIYKDSDRAITLDDINLLIIDNIDNIIYEFTNAILDNDLDKVTKMYNNFKIENISYDYLIVSIANSLRQALIIKMLHNDNESNINIAKVIGKKEFYVKKMLERIYPYSVSDLANYINKLSLIDRNYKTGESNIDELALFLLDKDK